EDRVIFAGHVDDVSEFLHQLDIFALPSSSEQHPNALLEAMACGLPCVATNVGGVGELLGQGRFGQLVEPDDLNAFTSALSELCKKPPLGRRFGEMSRGRVCEHYSMKQMILQYRRLYCSVTERSSRGHGVVRTPPKKTDYPRVVMLGPLPPLTGGMVTVVNNLRGSALAGRCRLTVLNNGKTTPEGRSVLMGIVSQMEVLRCLISAILRQRAQIVHIHTCSGFTFWRDCMHAMIARLLGSRIVWHVHGGGFNVFAAQQACIGKAIMRFALTHASAVIALSEDWVGCFRAIAPRANWRVVPNGVPISVKTVVVENRKPTFLFLGNLGEQKGAHDLVRAAAIASRKGFEGQIDLAGKETEPGQIEAIEKIIAETGCQSQVRLIGVISGEAKDKATESADCMVLPSYAEGLPMAILEAMACGLPIISTKVGAIPEVITDGVEGFLIEPGDIEALADCIVRLGKDSQLRQRMGDAARVRVQQRYSLQAMAERILEVYHGVLQNTLK
ncbi:MAG: glycosyltransferase, partial [Phycisphaerae bacterium]|nr:glycosyltransferase [Phycisphaerae bacterium]